MAKGNNMVRGKRSNKRAVLGLLLYQGGLSRKQLSARLELTPSAITVLVNEMISQKLLKEVRVINSTEKAAGRKEIMLDIDEQHYFALGISVNLDNIIISATTLKGALLWKNIFEFPEQISAIEFVEHTVNILNQEILERNINLDYAVGLGVIVRGWTDSSAGISIKSLGLWEDKNINLKLLFNQYINKTNKNISNKKLEITIENNVRGLANAQMILSNTDSRESMLFIRSELGIGGAMIINKELYSGHTFHAIDLGHITVEADGELCRCGRQGCLETIASNWSIEHHALGIYGEEITPILYNLTDGDIKNIDLQKILESANLGEKAIQVYLNRALSKFANVIRMVLDVLDPQTVILYGQSFENNYYYQTLKKLIFYDNAFDSLQNNVLKSEFNLALEQKSAPLIAVKNFFETGLED